MDWQALWLTSRLALSASVVLLVIGIPLGWWLASTRWRGRVFVEAIVALPLVLPPTVLGFYVLTALGPRTAIGRWIEEIFGHPIPFSFAGLLVASVLYSLPFAVQPITAGFRAIDHTLIEAASNLGAPPWRAFFRVAIPLARPGILCGVVLSFAHTLGEFGVVLMVGGNIPGSTRTISISVYDAVQRLDYASAGITAGVMLVFSFAILSLTFALQRDIRLAPAPTR
jgi:molybdate transport system permease protein